MTKKVPPLLNSGAATPTRGFRYHQKVFMRSPGIRSERELG